MDAPTNKGKSNKRPPETTKLDPRTHQDGAASHPSASSAKKSKPSHSTHHSKPGHERRERPDSATRTSNSSAPPPPNRQVVKASHILIKHQGSRRKASWKDPEGIVISATTRSAAVERLQQIREDIDSGKIRFEEAATQHSDCSSYKRGGDLGMCFFLFRVIWCGITLGRQNFRRIWTSSF
jgi:PPIC-type PPIASE domain